MGSEEAKKEKKGIISLDNTLASAVQPAVFPALVIAAPAVVLVLVASVATSVETRRAKEASTQRGVTAVERAEHLSLPSFHLTD